MSHQPSDIPTRQQVHFDTTSTAHDPLGDLGNSTQVNPGPSRSTSTEIDATLASPTNVAQASREGRIRISKACVPCRRVKLKCNGETPCGRCSSLNLSSEDYCVYPPSMRGKTRRKKSETEGDRRPEGASSQGGRIATLERSSQKRARPSSSGQHGDQGQDTRQWDQGWTMSSMKEDFEKWKDYEDITMNGPRNHNLWTNGETGHPLGASSSTTNGPSRRRSVSSIGHDILPDRYTTLPYPGDAHNPLGVLAEASASAGNAKEGITDQSPFQPTGGPGDRPGPEEGGFNGYYVPLERVLKKDAPHIMSLISIAE